MDSMTYVKDFDFEQLNEYVSHAKMTKYKKVTYYELVTSFDIESTSTIVDGQKVAFMYVWQFAFENVLVYGRTWQEYQDFTNKLAQMLKLDDQHRLIVYVHNLAFEFQFMRKYFDWESVFATDTRNPIKAVTDQGIEYKDSYILAGLNLDHVAKNLHKHKIKKLVGYLDYDQVRTYKTPLTSEELAYCANDIIIVVDYIHEQIDEYGSITNIPLTNTGRVRRYTKDQCYYNGKKHKGNNQYNRYRNYITRLTLEPDEYTMLKDAFQGGFTHANANKMGQLLENVASYDFTSSYPTVMLTEQYPSSSAFTPDIKSKKDFEFYRQHYLLVFDVKFTKVYPKIKQDHYLSVSKCGVSSDCVTDNGRIYSAESVETTITNIDLDILEHCYTWEHMELGRVLAYEKNYLPKPIIKAILHLYKQKTKLKGIPDKRAEYLNSKGMLNSMYGMSVTDIVHEENIYSGDDWSTEQPDLQDQIDKYNDSRNRFLFYPWGIFVTAYARRNLWSGIVSCGNDYCYSDTDSIKIEHADKHKKFIDHYNKIINYKIDDICEFYDLDRDDFAPVNQKGIKKPIGVWDNEGTYSLFKTLGAKRYLVYQNNELHLTCAGLSKSKGAKYLLKQSNNNIKKAFELFNDELTVPAEYTGKLTHTYVDSEQTVCVKDMYGELAIVNAKSGVHLAPCEFTLSISKQYAKFLKALLNGELYIGDDQHG